MADTVLFVFIGLAAYAFLCHSSNNDVSSNTFVLPCLIAQMYRYVDVMQSLLGGIIVVCRVRSDS